MDITLEEEVPLPSPLREKLKEKISKIPSLLQKEDFSFPKKLNVILVDNAYIKKLNAQYRKKPTPTDVLTFVYNEIPSPKDLVDAEIYISVEKAEEYAKKQGIPLEKELILLLLHGILHASGVDHERSKEEEEITYQKQEEWLKALFSS